MLRPPPTSTLFPYTTLFRSCNPLTSVYFLMMGVDPKFDPEFRLANQDKETRVLVLAYSAGDARSRSEEHTSELQSLTNLVCRLLLEKKKKNRTTTKQHETRI